MNKTILSLALATLCAGSASAFNQALYVKKGDAYTKYNFGVAADLNFSDGGKQLRISGYSDIINLDEIDGIYFNAPKMSGLTPNAQKEKMVSIGHDFYNLINVKSVAEGIRMFDAFTQQHDLMDPPGEYDVPQEYWDVHQEFSRVMKAVKDAVSGNPAAVRTLRAKAVNLYKMQDYFGAYVPDYENEVWVKKTDADFLEIRFHHPANPSNEYRVRLSASDDFDTWESADFKAQWPKKITVECYENEKRFAVLTINSDMVQEESITLDTEFTYGNHRVVNPLAITNKTIRDNVDLYIDGVRQVSANTVVYGNNLVKYDEMRHDIKEATHYHDEEGNCMGDEYGPLLAHFYRAVSNVDVMGQMQVKTQLFDFARIEEAFTEDDDEAYEGHYLGLPVLSVSPDGSIVSVLDGDPAESYDRQMSYLQHYTDAQFFYDGNPTMQGFITFELTEDAYDNTLYYDEDNDGKRRNGFTIVDNRLVYVYRDDNGSWFYRYYQNGQEVKVTVDDKDVIFPAIRRYVDYEIMPVLVFPDMTSYAFEDFFDEDSFSRLIDDVEDIVDVYDSLTIQDTPSNRH